MDDLTTGFLVFLTIVITVVVYRQLYPNNTDNLAEKNAELTKTIEATKKELALANSANENTNSKLASLQKELAEKTAALLAARNATVASVSRLPKDEIASALTVLNMSTPTVLEGIVMYYSTTIPANRASALKLYADGIRIALTKSDIAFEELLTFLSSRNVTPQITRFCQDVGESTSDPKYQKISADMQKLFEPSTHESCEYEYLPPSTPGGPLNMRETNCHTISDPSPFDQMMSEMQRSGIDLTDNDIKVMTQIVKSVITEILQWSLTTCNKVRASGVNAGIADSLQDLRSIYQKSKNATSLVLLASYAESKSLAA